MSQIDPGQELIDGLMRPSTRPYRLSAQSLKELRDAQRLVHDQIPAIQALQQCGVECQELVDVAAEIDRRIGLLITHFGGSKSPLLGE